MNIFFAHSDPRKAAINLNYPRLQNKMIVESCQLLCTTFNVHGIPSPYKTSFENHASRLWLDNDVSNIVWLIYHAKELINIYESRSGKSHQCAGILQWCTSSLSLIQNIPYSELTNPYLAMTAKPDIQDTHSVMAWHSSFRVWVSIDWNHAVTAYRDYLSAKHYWKPDYEFID